jgi:predicted nucleic acid-binding protein
VRRVLVDTSVLVKWFHAEGEADVEAARALLDAHLAERVRCHVLDLACYELGNVLVRPLGWAGEDVAAQLDDLVVIVGTPLTFAAEWFLDAATLAEAHRLTFYDAAWAAAARGLAIDLVSADRQLLSSRLAIGLSATASELP